MVGYLIDMELSETRIFYFKQTYMLLRSVTLSECFAVLLKMGLLYKETIGSATFPHPLESFSHQREPFLKRLDVKESKTGKYKRRYLRNVTFTYNLLEVLKEGGMRDKQ